MRPRELRRNALATSLAALLACAACTGGAPSARADGWTADSLSIGSWGEATAQLPDRTREDGRPSALLPSADPVRAGVLVRAGLGGGYALSAELLWSSGGTAGDSLPSPVVSTLVAEWRSGGSFGARAGRLWVPVGFENESHSPTGEPGALRTDVETRILPTPWSALGAGLFGALPNGLAWRAYVLEGLDAARFSAPRGIRDGRQDGGPVRLTHPAVAGRLDWSPGGLLVGGSAYSGDAWQRAQPEPGTTLHARFSLGEAHASLERGRLRARAMYAMCAQWDHAALSRVLGVANTNEAIGSRVFGGYVEAGWDVLPAAWPGTTRALVPFARFEESDTQDGVGAIGTEDPSHHGKTLTVGVSFLPHPDVALKVERQQRTNETHTQTGQWNAGLGYRF